MILWCQWQYFLRYVDRSASAAYQDYIEEQEKIRLEELEAEYYEENFNEEYYYQEGEGDYEYEECRVCDPEEYEQEYYEDPAPRFFFQEIQGIFDTTRGLPCCESPIRQTDTTPEPTGPRWVKWHVIVSSYEIPLFRLSTGM